MGAASTPRLLLLFAFFAACSIPALAAPSFGPAQAIGLIQDTSLNEKSGAAASLTQPGIVWTHEDGGNPAAVYAIESKTGKVLGRFGLPYDNADTEDMSRGPGGSLLLYVNKSRSVIRVDEPQLGKPYTPNLQQWKCSAWPAKGCEAAAWDPISGDIYLWEKYAAASGDRDRALWRIDAQALRDSGTQALTPALVAQLTFPAPGATDPRPSSADISPDGRLILVVMQSGLFVYERALTQSVADALRGVPVVLLPPGEGCGEAGCFLLDGSGRVIGICHFRERPDGKLWVRARLDAAEPPAIEDVVVARRARFTWTTDRPCKCVVTVSGKSAYESDFRDTHTQGLDLPPGTHDYAIECSAEDGGKTRSSGTFELR